MLLVLNKHVWGLKLYGVVDALYHSAYNAPIAGDVRVDKPLQYAVEAFCTTKILQTVNLSIFWRSLLIANPSHVPLYMLM